MRNILVFPDGTQQDFMYPENREITVGEKLHLILEDDTSRYLKVFHIQKTDKIIYYHLSY